MKKIYFIYLGAALIAGFMVTILLLTTRQEADSGERKYVFTCNGETKIPRLSEEASIEQLQKYFDGIHIPFGAKKSPAPAGHIVQEYLKVKNAKGVYKAAEDDIEWIMRGPSNVGGRTRGLLVDPDDTTFMTWYAGSASGGAWKTTDGGQTWTCLTTDLPLQATTTLAMAMLP